MIKDMFPYKITLSVNVIIVKAANISQSGAHGGLAHTSVKTLLITTGRQAFHSHSASFHPGIYTVTGGYPVTD